MPVYKDTERKTYYCKFSYQDWTGARRQKLKRGFSTKREATAWERNFLERQQGSPDMTLRALYDAYLEDMTPRLKESSILTKRRVIERYILPYLGDRAISGITSIDIRKWQSAIMGLTTRAGKPFTPAYLRNIDRQMAAMLNYAGMHYNLQGNAHQRAGSMGKCTVRGTFWTRSEFGQFIATVTDPQIRTLFTALYYTGLRLGELMALTPADLDLENLQISVTKTHRRRGGKDIITPPKTAHSVRTVTIPQFLADTLTEYMARIYGLTDKDRIFQISVTKIEHLMSRHCEAAGVKRLTPHGLRHSHVSLLIDLGFSVHLIAERIGDSVNMVNNVYGHLFENRHAEVADRLQELQRDVSQKYHK